MKLLTLDEVKALPKPENGVIETMHLYFHRSGDASFSRLWKERRARIRKLYGAGVETDRHIDAVMQKNCTGRGWINRCGISDCPWCEGINP